MSDRRDIELTNYISRAEAEELCDELIRQFTGSTSSDPNPVDNVSEYIHNELGLGGDI